MLSNIFARLLPTVRPMRIYQQHLVRLLNTAEATSTETISNNREKGVVKRFSKEKGFGFISKTSDGTDYFVHFKNINASGFKVLEQGQEVEFTVTQGTKGLEAKDVTVLDDGDNSSSFKSMFDRPSDDNSTSTSSNFGSTLRNRPSRSRSNSFSFGGDESSKLNSEEQDSTSTGRTYKFKESLSKSSGDDLFSSKTPQATNEQTREFGSVKRWTAERGFGFIRRASSGQDLFCHVRSLKDGVQSLEPGQSVEYSVHQTDKGEEARDVTILDGGRLTNQEQDNSSTENLGERHKGTVRKWLAGRGFGFIQRDAGGSDLFVHFRNLSNGAQSLEEGQAVEFNIAKNDKGEVAQNVTVTVYSLKKKNMRKNRKLVEHAKKFSSSDLYNFIVQSSVTQQHDHQIKIYHSVELSNEYRKQIIELFEINMKTLYEQSSVGYDFVEKQEELFSDQSRFLLILSSSTKDLLAFAHFRFDMDYQSHVLYVYELQVNRNVQGQGLGQLMIEQMKILCRKARMSKIVLTVHKVNKKAIKFYMEKCQFEIDITDPSDEPVDYLILSFTV
ncbi:unnamed protein product [Rotaria magnacalcarata]|uniref:N-alpha-acetyltransferase 40 n=1 Tax=Rotaria magnacalcarata TaxID=392030 RepID=A0A816UQX5_9BILA|nr:unnamed protein product [Rotaria magnacalcarata]